MFQQLINTFYALPSSNQLAALPVYPADYRGDISSVPYLKLAVVTGPTEASAYSTKEVRGVVLISIYWKGGAGQAYAAGIANTLDATLQAKNLTYGIQTSLSSLQFLGPDRDDPTLSRADYSVPFCYYGVTT